MSHIEIRFHSSLEKLSPFTAQESAPLKNLSGLWGEWVSFQISFQCSDTYFDDLYSCVTVECPGTQPQVYLVEQVPCTLPCMPSSTGAYLSKSPSLMPDPLHPYHQQPLRVRHFFSQILWAELLLTPDTPSGEITVTITDRSGKCVARAALPLQVVPLNTAPQTVNHSEWFYSDCLCEKYGCEMFSDEFFETAQRYFRFAAQHSINTLLTPVFTPSLDIEEGGRRPACQLVKISPDEQNEYRFDFSLFERWVRTAQQAGIEFFEIAPFFSQWGAKFAAEIYWETEQGQQTLFGWDTPFDSPAYAHFLKIFLKELMAALHRLGIADKTFFHISDEPSREHLSHYQTAKQQITPYIEDCPILDALSEHEFYKQKLVDIPVVAEDFLSPFLRNKRTGPLWTYCCCSQDRLVPNFFLSMPSARGRILGALMYKYKLDGFLRWGFNFWNSQFSKEPIDPYRVTDSGGGFPSGDAFLVYPGENGTPVGSIRLKVMREAFQDIRALNRLEQLSDRQTVLDLIQDTLGDIRFTRYPAQAQRLLDFRTRLNETLAKHSTNE